MPKMRYSFSTICPKPQSDITKPAAAAAGRGIFRGMQLKLPSAVVNTAHSITSIYMPHLSEEYFMFSYIGSSAELSASCPAKLPEINNDKKTISAAMAAVFLPVFSQPHKTAVDVSRL
ncbi:MAG: hypothetical protein IJR45_03380 [Firmicutes bacterium]|nr:hypothetical protein [Bacillota bacterium]